MPDRHPIKIKPAPINNTELVLAFMAGGGRVVHVRPKGHLRGVTIAYVVKGSRITFSTAVQHRHDPFTKKIGCKVAISHFLEGKTATLPLDKERFRFCQHYIFAHFSESFQ